MLSILHILFWASLAVVAAVYFGYPLTLAVLAWKRNRHEANADLTSVTLVISAYNEESVIAEKLENSLALDYPRDRLEILVISDASEDGTDRIAASFADRGVVLRRQEPRRGKSAGLTRFVPDARGQILVFSDANSMYEPDALRNLVRHFADPRVGFVVGNQRYRDERSAASQSESLYWRYETWLKIQENKVGSPVCGDGAIMAMRAALFEPLRDDDIADSILPLKLVARGYRGLFDQQAVCWERTAEDFWGEFRRRARIVNRAMGAVLRVPGTLNPFRVGIFTGQLLLHRVLRWLVPFFLVGMLLASGWLALDDRQLYQGLFLLQLAFYGTALLGIVPGVRRFKPVYVASYFCVANAAAALGILQLLFGKRIAMWTPHRSLHPAPGRPSKGGGSLSPDGVSTAAVPKRR